MEPTKSPARRVLVAGTDASKPAPVKKAAKKSAEKRAVKEAAAPGLAYPSPILGVPVGASSRWVDRALAFRKAAIAETHRKNVAVSQAEAAAKIGPLGAEERAELIAVKESYRNDVLVADRVYDEAVRAAQSVRDRAKNDAAAARDFCLKSAADSFRNAATPIEEAMKEEIAASARKSLHEGEEAEEEFNTYSAAAKKLDAERTEASIKADAAARAETAAAAAKAAVNEKTLATLNPAQRSAAEELIAEHTRPSFFESRSRRSGLGMALVASALALGGGTSSNGRR